MLIYIHAGMHKTGTTFIQNTLMENQSLLEKSGLGIWPHSINDVGVVRCVADDPTLKMAPEDVKSTKELFLRHLSAARERGARKYLLVGEGIGLRLNLEAVARLRAALEKFSTSVKIIFYVREPVSFSASSIQESVKQGERLVDMRMKRPLPGYRKRMGAFFKVYQRKDIEVGTYDKRKLEKEDVLDDYFNIIDEMDVLEKLTPSQLRNRISLC